MTAQNKLLISFVVPVFNEEENVLPFYQAVSHQADLLAGQYDFEFVFTDNHSTDRTFVAIRIQGLPDSEP